MAKLYGCVNNQTKQVTKLYGPVEKMSGAGDYEIDGSQIQSFSPAAFTSHLEAYDPTLVYSGAIDWNNVFLKVTAVNPLNSSLEIAIDDNTPLVVLEASARNATFLGKWGIKVVNASAGTISHIEFIPEFEWVTKEIVKLYGAINGETKLVYG